MCVGKLPQCSQHSATVVTYSRTSFTRSDLRRIFRYEWETKFNDMSLSAVDQVVLCVTNRFIFR